MITEYQQGVESLDENIDFDADEDSVRELEDNTLIDTEHFKKKADKNITTAISECQEDGEVLDDETNFATGNMKKTTNETVENEMAELQI